MVLLESSSFGLSFGTWPFSLAVLPIPLRALFCSQSAVVWQLLGEGYNYKSWVRVSLITQAHNLVTADFTTYHTHKQSSDVFTERSLDVFHARIPSVNFSRRNGHFCNLQFGDSFSITALIKPWTCVVCRSHTAYLVVHISNLACRLLKSKPLERREAWLEISLGR